MKNVPSLKPSDTNSPKTPGGISKSLLTPCRRLGLSRNWRKSGPSPFISPLSGRSTDVKEEKPESRKRKERVPEQKCTETEESCPNDDSKVNTDNIDGTPARNVDVPRRKRSKTLISAINKSQVDISPNSEDISENHSDKKVEDAITEPPLVDSNTENIDVVSTPVRTKSKKSKKRTPEKNTPTDTNAAKNEIKIETNTPFTEKQPNEEIVYSVKQRSPNDLSKECIVVLQKKIFKNVSNSDKIIDSQIKPKQDTPIDNSDSDSDETPLINLHKQNSASSYTKTLIDEDDDFIDNKSKNNKKQKLKETKSPKSKPKSSKPLKTKVEKIPVTPRLVSQSCFDDDDDDFDNRKTILVKKTYEKPSKPIKSKSTGSITQKDIDNLRSRIEAKKKLLLAQSLTPDTEELRNLIKKWQKGCQDALMQLLDLMKNTFPEKERMDHSEMLKTLKIPASLVGYDSENDCFHSPDDASIILSQFKDL